MHPTTAKVIIGIVAIVGSFFVGRCYQHMRTGYERKEIVRKDYEHPFGLLSLHETFESVGFAFMNTGTTEIWFDHRIIYKAQCGFQESYPVARDVSVTDNTVRWRDGQFTYALTIEKEERKEPGVRLTEQ